MTRLGFIRRTMLRKRPWLWSASWTLVAVAVGTLLRMPFGGLIQGVPFNTYYPMTLLAAVFLGWRWGIAAAVLSALLADYLFLEPIKRLALSPTDLGSVAFFLASCALIVATAQTLRRTMGELEEARGREVELNAELQHRVKNNLAVVQGLAVQTARYNPEPPAFLSTFTGRLEALASAHGVLSHGRWDVCRMPELLDAALRPFRAGAVIEVAGPACALPGISCTPLVLALHELGTNALKHGALSAAGGRVAVTWEVEGAANERFVLSWREEGGPPVKAPTRRGLGSRLLTKQAGLDAVTLTFAPEGVTCEIAVSGAERLD